jgi:hypothetical protein
MLLGRIEQSFHHQGKRLQSTKYQGLKKEQKQVVAVKQIYSWVLSQKNMGSGELYLFPKICAGILD